MSEVTLLQPLAVLELREQHHVRYDSLLASCHMPKWCSGDYMENMSNWTLGSLFVTLRVQLFVVIEAALWFVDVLATSQVIPAAARLAT